MTELAYATTIFCEDVREEKNEQSSFIGVFRSKMKVPELPIIMPRLGFYISLVLPKAKPIAHITTKIYLPGDALDEPTYAADADVQDIGGWMTSPEDGRPEFEDPDVVMPIKLDQSLVFSPATINCEGFIKVRVEVDGLLIKAGTLKVVKEEPEPISDEHIIPISLKHRRS